MHGRAIEAQTQGPASGRCPRVGDFQLWDHKTHNRALAFLAQTAHSDSICAPTSLPFQYCRSLLAKAIVSSELWPIRLHFRLRMQPWRYNSSPKHCNSGKSVLKKSFSSLRSVRLLGGSAAALAIRATSRQADSLQKERGDIER